MHNYHLNQLSISINYYWLNSKLVNACLLVLVFIISLNFNGLNISAGKKIHHAKHIWQKMFILTKSIFNVARVVSAFFFFINVFMVYSCCHVMWRTSVKWRKIWWSMSFKKWINTVPELFSHKMPSKSNIKRY